MKSVQQLIEELAREGVADIVPHTSAGVQGIITADDQRFIPLPEVGYNADLGLYDRRQFLREESDYAHHPWRVPPAKEGGVALVDWQGNGIYFAEEWQAIEAAYALMAYARHGTAATPITLADGRLGQEVNASTAASLLSEVVGYEVKSRTVTAACTRGDIAHAHKRGNLWWMPRAAVLAYASQFRARTQGGEE